MAALAVVDAMVNAPVAVGVCAALAAAVVTGFLYWDSGRGAFTDC